MIRATACLPACCCQVCMMSESIGLMRGRGRQGMIGTIFEALSPLNVIAGK